MVNSLESSWQWVIDDELADVFTRLDNLYKIDPDSISGVGMSFVVQRLVDSEAKVGGPYRNRDGEVSFETNAIIDRFLRHTGTELPNLKPYRTGNKVLIKKQPVPQHDQGYDSMQQAVEIWIAQLPLPVRAPTRQIWQSIKEVDKNREMGQITTFFSQSMLVGTRPSEHRLRLLGMANFYVWMAYTIYDDFFDDEGDPAQLAVANIAMRSSWDGYRSVWKNLQSCQLVDMVFLCMDAANAWEVAHARAKVVGHKITFNSLPNYGSKSLLARRAMAHVLGPLLVTQNSDATSKQYTLVEKGLTQFLIARQLNDDIHDWRKDLQAGHLSPIVVYLLRACDFTSGQYNLATVIEQAEQYFWEKGLDEVCQMTLKHIAKCRQTLSSSRLLDMNGPFFPLIDRLKDAITAGQASYQADRDFLESYKSLQNL